MQRFTLNIQTLLTIITILFLLKEYHLLHSKYVEQTNECRQISNFNRYYSYFILCIEHLVELIKFGLSYIYKNITFNIYTFCTYLINILVSIKYIICNTFYGYYLYIISFYNMIKLYILNYFNTLYSRLLISVGNVDRWISNYNTLWCWCSHIVVNPFKLIYSSIQNTFVKCQYIVMKIPIEVATSNLLTIYMIAICSVFSWYALI